MMQKSTYFATRMLAKAFRNSSGILTRGSARFVHRSTSTKGPQASGGLDFAAATRSSEASSLQSAQLPGTGWNVSALRKTKLGVEVLWDNDERSLFHYEWLYRNRPDVFFTCGQNMQQPTDRLKSELHEINVSLGSDGETLRMKWNETSPESLFKLVWLRQCAYSDSWKGKLETARKPVPLRTREKQDIAIVQYENVINSDEGVKEWLEHVNRDGLCLMNGVPLVSGTVSKVAERIGSVMRTIYGTEFDVQAVKDPINVAYSNEGLDLHQDLAYYESPPALQHLHCLRFDEGIVGGESTFADAFHCAELLREQDPQAFKTLCRVPATFQKIHYDRPDPVHLQHRRPHICVNDQGAVTSVFWAPPFEGPLQVPECDVEEYFRAYHAFAMLIEAREHQETTRIQTRLQPGTLVTFNNRRMVHGRSRFHEQSAGGRHLQGCYTSMEVYVNRLRVLQNRGLDPALRSPGIPIARVGDQDHS
mmetsp:Transcript_7630/g.15309  ORF Transcript_7630/g.15309 Transcript_7630/m.15309 type:complete len:477 (+) Transcript_7630:85-1515(+)